MFLSAGASKYTSVATVTHTGHLPDGKMLLWQIISRQNIEFIDIFRMLNRHIAYTQFWRSCRAVEHAMMDNNNLQSIMAYLPVGTMACQIIADYAICIVEKNRARFVRKINFLNNKWNNQNWPESLVACRNLIIPSSRQMMDDKNKA